MPHTKFSLQEAAEYLHLPMEDVRRLVRNREIPFQDNKGRITFTRGELDAWASQRLLGSSEENVADYHRRSSAKMHDLSRSSRIISELIRPGFIDPSVSSRTRSSVIRDMVGLADKTGLLYDRDALMNDIDQREKLCSTALSGGLALLHGQHHDPYMCEDSFIVLGRTVQPIPFGAPDGKQTDLFFLICCQDDRIHLHVLARLCMLCYHTPLLNGLRDAESAAEMYEVVRDLEAGLVRDMVKNG